MQGTEIINKYKVNPTKNLQIINLNELSFWIIIPVKIEYQMNNETIINTANPNIFGFDFSSIFKESSLFIIFPFITQ